MTANQMFNHLALAVLRFGAENGFSENADLIIKAVKQPCDGPSAVELRWLKAIRARIEAELGGSGGEGSGGEDE